MISFSRKLTAQEEKLVEKLNGKSLPAHVAIIMDGNGRWAKQRAQNRLFGHHHARKTVRLMVETAREVGLDFLTLYTFSTENWKRSKLEVAGLMKLLETVLTEELPDLHANAVKVVHLGEKGELPLGVRKILEKAENLTASNDGLTLVLAINYGGRRELVLAARDAAVDCSSGKISPDDLLDEDLFESYLQTGGFSDPDLMIRTAGEQRISNFLLWKLAYSELYFTDVFWPAFTREDFLKALLAYQDRERRYGGVL